MNNTQQFTAQFSINGQQAKDEIKRITERINELDKAMLKVDKTTAQGREQFKKMHEEQERNKKDLRDMNQMSKVLKNMFRDLDKASPNQLRQTMRDINKAMDSGAIKRGTRDWKEALKVLGQCDTELKKIKAEQTALGKGGGLGSLFGGGFGGITKLAGMFGLVTSAVGGLAKVLGDVYSKNKEFEQANANLASVLGTTRDNIKGLTNEAKMLGSTTQYTASQVTGLQTELAKLGFTASEISSSTKGILDFAAATGAELPEAASVAGAALRAFGMDAAEMDRVVSTMAVATTKSALDFGKLQNSISIVAPVAKQFGFSIEETVALLGKLSDAGFDASSAATATRNIMLYMSDSSSKLSKALGRPIKSINELGSAFEELKSKNIELADMLDLTDKRAVAAFATLVSSGDGLVKLNEEITDCNDALGAMVDERMNTLEGSTIKLSSAWDGLMLTFSNSNGVFKAITDALTSMVNGLTTFFATIEENQEKEVFEGVTAATKEEQALWKDIADSIDESDIEYFLQDYADGLDNAKKKAKATREEIQRLNQARKLGLGTAQGAELAGGMNFDQVKARTASLQSDLIKYETSIKKYEYLQNRLKNVATGSTTSSAQSDPKRLKIAKLDSQAASDRLGVMQDETLSEEAKADRIYAINKALYEAKRDLYNQDEKEYFTYNKQVLDIEAKHQAELLKRSKKADEAARKELQFQDRINAGNKQYESAMAKLTAEELRYQGIVAGDESWKIRQQKAVNSLKIQREALTRTYDAAKENLDKMEQAEIDHGANEQETREKYLQKRNELDEKYNAALEANTTATNATIAANTKETFKKAVDSIQMAMEQISSVMSHFADMVSSSYDLQIAKVEERYDAEIEAAKDAGKDTTDLEKQKEQEVSQIQLKQAEAQFKADIAQSFIDAAMASSRAWADNPWPVALALQSVIAANQIMTMATLKNQFDAKKVSIGQFYDGGYTGDDRKYHRAVGIVHDGEFVANHNAVNNPEIRPALDALDYAQRTNTISSMTRGDLAAAIGYENGGYTSGHSTPMMDDSAIRQLSAVLNRIEQNGIYAINTISGRTGIDNSIKKYNKLRNTSLRQ